MRTTTSLSFSKEGLLNPESVDFFLSKNINTLVVFGDGTEEAFEHIRSFDYAKIITDPSQLAIGRLPLYDLRVIGLENTLSKPNYVYTETNRIDWLCSSVCAPCITISASDITSKTDTKVILSTPQVELMCDMTYRFWAMLQTAEDHLRFPAIALDALSRWSRLITPETIDIAALRAETGMHTLDYNGNTDMLSVSIVDEIFTVKLSVLNEFFKDIILPFFNRYQGRRYRLEVSVLGITDQGSQPQTMSYGELGRIVTQMQSLTKMQKITTDNPMDPNDLLLFSKKVKINEESCLFAQGNQTLDDFILSTKPELVRFGTRSNTSSSQHIDYVQGDAILEHS